MSEVITPEQQTVFEYVHSCYSIDKREGSNNDAIFCKRNRVIINKDGNETVIPEYHMHENVERDFWITKKAFRKHEYKIEYEHISRLDHYRCTQRNLARQIAYKTGQQYDPRKDIKEYFKNQYVYGCEIDINSVLKLQYKNKFPRKVYTPLSYAVQDIEFDVVSQLGMIIFSMSYKDRAYQAVLKNWVNPGETQEEYQEFIINELPEIAERNIKLEVEFVDNMVDGIVKMFQKSNEWMPDIIGYWNINFDMTVILELLDKHNIDPKDVFSHPSVPAHYRHFEYKRGAMIKKKDDGSSRPLAPSEQWHTVFTTSPFYFIDPMSMFRTLNKMKAEPSYSLDYLTNKFLGKGKYHFEHEILKNVPLGSLKWHMLMQKHFKKQYCAYGLIDCIRVEQFEEHDKINNISLKLPIVIGDSQFQHLPSNPRQLCDDFHSFCLENKHVISVGAPNMQTELDLKVVGKSMWINILEATHLEDIGIQLVDDPMFRRSRLTILNYDLDLTSAYPKIGILLGLSRRNTVFEICKIQGMSGFKHRYNCVNLTGGDANAVLTSKEFYKLDPLEALHHKFAKAHNIPVN